LPLNLSCYIEICICLLYVEAADKCVYDPMRAGVHVCLGGKGS
jgi:hypothetical protein